MSQFRHNRRSRQTPELKLLLAKIAIRQAASPTASAVISTGAEATAQSGTAEIQPFLERRVVNGSARASFSPAIAKALLTSGKPS